MRPGPRVSSKVLQLALVLIAARPVAQAQAPRPHPREWSSGGPLRLEQAGYDVTFYDLDLRVSPADSTIRGAVAVHARVLGDLDRLALDLDSVFVIDSITDLWARPAVRLDSRRAGGRLSVVLPRRHRPGDSVVVRIAYRGRPRIAERPPWIGGFQWARTPSGAPWIATTCVNEGADIWWPVKDHPSDKADSVGLTITVPRGLVVAANGQPRGERANSDGTTTFRWMVTTPISNYNVALNIAPYRTITREYRSVTGESFPVTYWVLPEHHEKGLALIDEIVTHLRFYEELLGPYPFRADKYGVAETPHLGMEHQTIIAYGNQYRRNADGYDELHQHELAHEWFGNLVTARDWSDYWLHEGFGSYMQPLYAERLHGKAGLIRAVERLRGGVKNRHPIAQRAELTAGEVYFEPPDYLQGTGDIYGKGALVLHALRYLVGDAVFFPMLRRFLYPTPESERVTDGSQVRLVTTDDFIHHAGAMAGRPLDWFFEVYARRATLPRLEATRTDSALALRWVAPDGLSFPMPIEIEIDGERRRVEMTGGQAQLSVGRGARVNVDPDGWVLRQ